MELTSLKVGLSECLPYLKLETFGFDDAINARSNVGFSLLAPEGTFETFWRKDYGLITAGVTESENYEGL